MLIPVAPAARIRSTISGSGVVVSPTKRILQFLAPEDRNSRTSDTSRCDEEDVRAAGRASSMLLP